MTTETTKVRKRLSLLFPVQGETMFHMGGDAPNCDAITRLPSGGYEIQRGREQFIVEAGRVDHYWQDPRPGYEQEQRDAARDLPSFAEALEDGTFLCRTCNHVAKSVHALKVHHGRQHHD